MAAGRVSAKMSPSPSFFESVSLGKQNMMVGFVSLVLSLGNPSLAGTPFALPASLIISPRGRYAVCNSTGSFIAVSSDPLPGQQVKARKPDLS